MGDWTNPQGLDLESFLLEPLKLHVEKFPLYIYLHTFLIFFLSTSANILYIGYSEAYIADPPHSDIED